MNTDSVLKIESFFNTNYTALEADANRHSKRYIDNLQLSKLSLEQQIIKIYKELNLLTDEINNSEAYKYIYTGKKTGGKLFKNSLILHKTNEIKLLEEALLLKEKHNRLLSRSKELTALLSTFTWANYIASEKNVLFYDIHTRPIDLDEETYNKMRADQAEKIFKALSLETERFKAEFCKNGNAEQVDKEIDLLENIYLNIDSLSPEELINKFAQSPAFKHLLIDEEAEKLTAAFKLLANGEYSSSRLTPGFLLAAIKEINQGKYSPSELLASSLLQYDKWLCRIQGNKQNVSALALPDYSKIFDIEYKRAQTIVNTEIEKYSDIDDQTQLSEKLEATRRDYNSLKSKKFYALLLEDKTLKSFFVNYAMENDIEEAIEELHKAVSINDRFVYFAQRMGKLNPNFYKEYAEQKIILTASQLFQIIPMISTDNETIKELINAPKTILEATQKWRTPIYFTAHNFCDTLSVLYNKTVDRLEEKLRQTPSNQKGHYVTTELSQIRKTELCAKRNHFKLAEQFKDLEELLEIEQQEIIELNKGSKIDIENLLNAEAKEKSLSFGYKKSEPSYIRNIIQALCVKIDFLDNRTTVDDCVKILTSKDLKKETIEIHLECNTNEFAYTLKNLRYLFKSLTPANIEKSQLFYTKSGTQLNAQNLYSNQELSSSKITIDRIFKEQQ